MDNEKIVIIGGGLIGYSTAYMIKKIDSTKRVLLLDPSHKIQSSYQNDASLSYTFNRPYFHYSSMLKSLYSSEYISINSSIVFSPAFWLWALRSIYSSFLPNIQSDLYFTLGKRSAELHSDLKKDLKLYNLPNNYLFSCSGFGFFYSEVSKFNEAKLLGLDIAKKFSQFILILITRQSVSKYEPSVQDWKSEVVGFVRNNNEEVSSCDSNKLTSSLSLLSRSLGVEVLPFEKITSFNVENGKVNSILVDQQLIEADKIVLCNGFEAKDVGQQLGWTVPVWPGKRLTLNMQTKKTIKNGIFVDDNCPVSIVPLSDQFRISSYLEFFDGKDSKFEQEKVGKIESKIKEILKIEDAQFKDQFCYSEDFTPDDLPIIGKFPSLSNVFLNTGHGRFENIFCLSSAELIGHQVLGKSPLLDPRPFLASRFRF